MIANENVSTHEVENDMEVSIDSSYSHDLPQLSAMLIISMAKLGFWAQNKSTSNTSVSGWDAKNKPATIAHVTLCFDCAVLVMSSIV